MLAHEDFIFEIGTEELPAKVLQSLECAFISNVKNLLAKAKLAFHGEMQSFATPRRLAIFIPQLQIQQADQILERKGPNINTAFNESGEPTSAALGFAKSCGLEITALEKRETPQGSFLFAHQKSSGLLASEILPTLFQEALAKLPIAKPMRWGNHTHAFLRPVRWVLMMLGSNIIEANFYNQVTNNLTYGHRFLSPGAITINHAKNYENLLAEKGKVIGNFLKRQQAISQQLQKIAAQKEAHVPINPALLNEVTGLVEWPEVLAVDFLPRYLKVPKNALISAMETHQKSFPLLDKKNNLCASFLTVSNLVSDNPLQVVIGNARVMNARLNDAEFFYQQDLLTPLADYLPSLKQVVFQTKLGSLYTKSEAVAKMAGYLAKVFNFKNTEIKEAAMLAKCDLRTQMVGEFPELQGEMGAIYATKSGYSNAISQAIFEQYLPRFANDELPTTPMGLCLALADRLMNLVGIFAIGLIPTGEKDPFGLRRAAIGICRLLIENQLNLNLTETLIQAETIWRSLGANFNDANGCIERTQEFIIERLKNIYLEHGLLSSPTIMKKHQLSAHTQDFLESGSLLTPHVIQSVFALHLNDLFDIERRLQAVNSFALTEGAKTLSAAQKRVHNILKQEKILIDALELPDPTYYESPAEHNLTNALQNIQIAVANSLQAFDYTSALNHLATLKEPVDTFFDQVMVMAKNPIIRHNRLCLLAQLYKNLNRVANISFLH